MATLWRDIGTVRIHRDAVGPGLWRARFIFETDADGYASRPVPFPIGGTLLRFSSRCPTRSPGITGACKAHLFDEWGADQFGGLCDSLDPDGSSDGSLYLDLDGADRRRALVVAGEFRIAFDRSVTAPHEIGGIFDLYWTERVDSPEQVLVG